MLFDRQGRCLTSNRPGLTMMKISENEVIGREFRDIWPEDIRPMVDDSVRKVLEGQRGSFDAYRMNGREKGWWRVSLTPIFDTKGIVHTFIAMSTDITNRVRMEEALRESAKAIEASEQKYRNLFHTVNDAIMLVDPMGHILDVNDNVCDLLGYQRDELLKMTPRDFDTPEFAARIPERLGEVWRMGSAIFETAWVDRDGMKIPIEISARVVEYVGKPAMLAIARNITERKQTEEKIRQSEAFIRNILDSVDPGFLVIDRDFLILTANKSYCEQLGVVCGAIIGRPCYEVSHKSSRPCYEQGEDCAARLVFKTGKPYSALHKHTDAKGMIMHVETKGFPIKDGSGAVTSVIETINNVTEKHLLEEERLKTQKLESIGILAGGIAHDFNNLLQGIFGFISMAKRTYDQKEKSLAMLEQAEKALYQSVNLTT